MSLRLHLASLLSRAHPGPAFLLFIGLASIAFAGGQTTTINVTTSIHDDDTAVPASALLTQSDDYVSCGTDTACATYATTGKCPSNCLTSRIFTSGGGWQLLLANQTLRTIRLTTSFVSGTYVPFTGSYYAKVEVYSNCWADSAETTQTGLLVIKPGTSNSNCALGLDFELAGIKYKLEMGQTAIDSGMTGKATVSCTSTGSTCTSWTIVPNTAAPNPGIANLYQFTTKGLSFVGQYINTYRIDVTIP